LESAKKELKKLPKNVSARILEKIILLSSEPRPNGSKKLKSFDLPNNPYKNLYRIRIGDYRAIYAIEDQVLVVVVVKIANRKEVYE
jgi:mRNA interferase RelE/StbE